MFPAEPVSKQVYVPSAVSSFFEICGFDGPLDFSSALHVGARGGGFVIERGSLTVASVSNEKSDSVYINKRKTPHAITTMRTIRLMRKDHPFPPVTVHHTIEPPIGAGFGTSGSGSIGASIALSDLFGLHLSLRKISDYSHVAEIESVTGLGTVISLVSGSGAVGLVTEPGSFGFGRVDSFLLDMQDYSLICASFGSISKSSVLKEEKKRKLVSKFGRDTLQEVLKEGTPEALLAHSRTFAERTGIASKKILQISDKAKEFGAVGATQNMIGNAVHCLVHKSNRKSFLNSFLGIVPNISIFESKLTQSAPKFV